MDRDRWHRFFKRMTVMLIVPCVALMLIALLLGSFELYMLGLFLAVGLVVSALGFAATIGESKYPFEPPID